MITWPNTPAPQTAAARLLDFGSVLRPATGAAAQRIDRAGSRWIWQVTMPPVSHADAEVLRGYLSAARREGLRMRVPLSGRSQGNPGTPLVNGAGQSGTTLVCDGFAAGYIARAGFWFHVVDAAGTRYLHKLNAEVTASALGAATLAFDPPLRAALADNSVIEMSVPTVEGIVTSDVEWELTTSFLGQVSFTLEESA